jgi:putative hydrolase of the HAD superfamily
MKFPKAILIDLDDTILDDAGCTESCWTDACAAAEERHGFEAAALKAVVKECASVWWSDDERHRIGRLDLRAATTEIVTEALGRIGHDCSAASAIANHYRDLREQRVAVFEGAIATLSWLRDRGVKLGMMTNGAGPAQRAKIDRFELAAHFEHIIIEGEFGVGKPHPSVYQTLLRELRVTPAETWTIGDNLRWDVYPAIEMGMHGIWVDASDRGVPVDWREPDRIVRSMNELRVGL